jgi:hypothetical protein
VSQDGEGFGFSMLALQPSHEFLSFRVVAEKQDSRFRKGPLEMNVADLFAGEAIVFPGRLATALDETTVGDKLLHTREAGDVMDLVEDGQSQDLADAGDRTEQVERVMILLFGLAGDE